MPVHMILDKKQVNLDCLLSRPAKAQGTGREPKEIHNVEQAIKVASRKRNNFHLCRYFETYVLGLARGNPDYVEALEIYNGERMNQGKAPIPILTERECECGNPLLPRQRVCKSCLARRKKQAKREKVRIG